MADTPARRVYTPATIDDITPGKNVYREGDYKEYTIASTDPENLVNMPFDKKKRGAVKNFKTFKIVSVDDNKEYTAIFNEAKDEIIIMDNGIYVLYTDRSHDPGLVNNNDAPRGPVPSPVINNDVPRGPVPRGPAPSFVIRSDSDPSPVTRSDSDPRPVNHVGGKKSRRRVRRRKNRRTRSRK